MKTPFLRHVISSGAGQIDYLIKAASHITRRYIDSNNALSRRCERAVLATRKVLDFSMGIAVKRGSRWVLPKADRLGRDPARCWIKEEFHYRQDAIIICLAVLLSKLLDEPVRRSDD